MEANRVGRNMLGCPIMERPSVEQRVIYAEVVYRWLVRIDPVLIYGAEVCHSYRSMCLFA